MGTVAHDNAEAGSSFKLAIFFNFFVTHTDHSTNPVIIIGDESFGFKAVEFANITWLNHPREEKSHANPAWFKAAPG